MPAEAEALLAAHPALAAVLTEHGRLGFFGPGATPGALVAHALRFDVALRPSVALADLGSGGGVPGLVLALARPELQVLLVEVSATRADALARAVARLGLGGRVRVDRRPAEQVGRDLSWRGVLDAVVARSFGPPAVVAEAAAPLLRVGGQLVVSEPPAADDRWPATELQALGLEVDPVQFPGVRSLTQVAAAPDRAPRRKLRPPLF
jgi:16S rRNA (guanine527-N7)-methyltransferase